ncbi:iron chelate uptake ABC transporter family permease subunit [Vibrio hepatarius]|uniref:iron chelate uptake ABC transporter family permease subunit n=1 Tax=Vibrio hepatarius TaxID=171383 RepID=UPI001C0A14BC|nr:iron chelate uptake ABC transporter family permease subunit [Vibrio hepatarius]MBU2896739.1 iron ABC transporter permease [Vibrio hepatarius]
MWCKYRLAWFFGAMALAIAFVLSLKCGSVSLSLGEIVKGLGEFNYADMSITSRIFIDVRLPRAILAVVAGVGLAMVGALLQTSTKNDLADPFLFGLSSGASAGAVILLFGDLMSRTVLAPQELPVGIVTAALGGLFVLYRVGYQKS